MREPRVMGKRVETRGEEVMAGGRVRRDRRSERERRELETGIIRLRMN